MHIQLEFRWQQYCYGQLWLRKYDLPSWGRLWTPRGVGQTATIGVKIDSPYQESLEIINLGSEECKKEIKIGANLQDDVKKGLIELLHEYVDVFAWSYQDMPELDTDIVMHRLPLK